MNLFQKVLLISALIPYYSCIIVNLVTYVVCWKKKLSFAPFVICFFAYGILMFLVINCNVLPLIKYIASCFVALVGNYCLISLQMRDWQIPICLTVYLRTFSSFSPMFMHLIARLWQTKRHRQVSFLFYSRLPSGKHFTICEANYFTCEADFTQPKVGFHFFVASATKNKKPRRAV